MIEKAGGLADNRDPQAFEAFLRIVWRDLGDDAFDVRLHFGPVDAWRSVDAKPARVARFVSRLRCGDQGLRWHATPIEAIAAHLAILEQHDLEAKLRCARRR